MILTDGTFITLKQEIFPFEKTPGANSVMKQQPKEDFVSDPAGSFPKIFKQEMSIMRSQQMFVLLELTNTLLSSLRNMKSLSKSNMQDYFINWSAVHRAISGTTKLRRTCVSELSLNCKVYNCEGQSQRSKCFYCLQLARALHTTHRTLHHGICR